MTGETSMEDMALHRPVPGPGLAPHWETPGVNNNAGPPMECHVFEVASSASMMDESTSSTGVGPVIVIGMHRSGTTAVARVLSTLGVDMGRLLDPNHEPRTYMALNDWILHQAGTSWEYPLAVERLIANRSQFTRTVGAVSHSLGSPALRFSHRSRSGRKGERGSGRPWGWKDPRNTATLPIWLEIFPSSRVVAVTRHGVPVAASLVRRQRRSRVSPDLRHRLLAPVKPGPFIGTRTADLDNALALWSDYNDLIPPPGRPIGPGRHPVLSIRYETLITEPDAVVGELARFVGIEPDNGPLTSAISLIETGDPYSFRRDPELRTLELSSADALARHGYGLEHGDDDTGERRARSA
jgi:hypothetical protein